MLRKSDIVNELLKTDRFETKKACEDAVNLVFSTMTEMLKKDDISISDFGVFKTVLKEAHTMKSPQGKKIKVKAKKYVRFKAFKNLQTVVNSK